jgi:prepilin-type N-terminal cleavage/methylation domain-containing protein
MTFITKANRGFTLIELLMVIAIIGLLATMAVTSLNNARQKSRDARRVSDIKQLMTALEMYVSGTTTGLYPVQASTALELGSANAKCLGPSGFAATCSSPLYLGKIDGDPGVDSGYAYSYGVTDGTSYTITFGLTGKTGQLICTSGYDATCCQLSPTGIDCSL